MMETTISSPFDSSDVQEPPSRGENVTTANSAEAEAILRDPQALLEVVTRSLDDDKAEDITVIDLADKTSIADYMVVASGRSGRQVSALADHLIRTLKELGMLPKVEGKANSDWVIVDAASIVVHLFRPEVRTFYNLEKMWSQDTIADEVAKKRPFDQANMAPSLIPTGISNKGAAQLSA